VISSDADGDGESDATIELEACMNDVSNDYMLSDVNEDEEYSSEEGAGAVDESWVAKDLAACDAFFRDKDALEKLVTPARVQERERALGIYQHIGYRQNGVAAKCAASPLKGCEEGEGGDLHEKDPPTLLDLGSELNIEEEEEEEGEHVIIATRWSSRDIDVGAGSMYELYSTLNQEAIGALPTMKEEEEEQENDSAFSPIDNAQSHSSQDSPVQGVGTNNFAHFMERDQHLEEEDCGGSDSTSSLKLMSIPSDECSCVTETTDIQNELVNINLSSSRGCCVTSSSHSSSDRKMSMNLDREGSTSSNKSVSKHLRKRVMSDLTGSGSDTTPVSGTGQGQGQDGSLSPSTGDGAERGRRRSGSLGGGAGQQQLQSGHQGRERSSSMNESVSGGPLHPVNVNSSDYWSHSNMGKGAYLSLISLSLLHYRILSWTSYTPS
jgi:hypothetical protein